MQSRQQPVQNFPGTSKMEACMVIFINLLRAALCTTTAIMDTPFLEIVSEYAKPMEHGQVKNQRVVSTIVYGVLKSQLVALVATYDIIQVNSVGAKVIMVASNHSNCQAVVHYYSQCQNMLA